MTNINSPVHRGSVLVLLTEESERQWHVSHLKAAGFIVRTATYDTFAQTAGEMKPDLIILDGDSAKAPHPLPIVRALQADERTRRIGVVVLLPSDTSSHKVFDDLHYAGLFATQNLACVSKPWISPEELVSYVNRCLDGRKEHPL